MTISKRTASRVAAVQILYAQDISENKFNNSELISVLLSCDEELLGQEEFLRPDKDFLIELLEKISEEINEIDEVISINLNRKWELSKLNIVIRAMLRSAVSELLYYPGIDAKIIINEYTNLAAAFVDLPEVGFVNGILDKISNRNIHNEDKLI